MSVKNVFLSPGKTESRVGTLEQLVWFLLPDRFLAIGQWFEVILASFCPLERAAKVVLASAVDDEGGNLGSCTLLLFCSAWCLVSWFYCCDIPRSSWKLMADQLSPRHFWPRWLSLQPLHTYLYINVMRENTKIQIPPLHYPCPLSKATGYSAGLGLSKYSTSTLWELSNLYTYAVVPLLSLELGGQGVCTRTVHHHNINIGLLYKIQIK